MVTLGNPDAGADALGEQVARRLEANPPAGLELLRLGMDPTRLLDTLDSDTPLIIIDAIISSDLEPGTVVEIDWCDPDRPGLLYGDRLSSHGLSLPELLELADKLNCLPPSVHLIGAVVDPKLASNFMDFHLVDQIVERVILLHLQ